MSYAEWGVPLLLGVVVAGGLYLWDPAPPAPGPDRPELEPPLDPAQARGLFVLVPAADAPAGNYTLLQTPFPWPDGLARPGEGLLHHTPWVRFLDAGYEDGVLSVARPADCGAHEQARPGDEVTAAPATSRDAYCRVPWDALRIHAEDGVEGEAGTGPGGPGEAAPVRVVGADGWVVNATLFVLDRDGRLLATNAPPGQRGGLLGADGALELPAGPWWLGTGAAPNGTRGLGLYAAPARAALEGVPEGGVASLALYEHDYVALVGPLFLTGRVDGVAAGP